MKVWLRRKRNSLREISSNWNKLAAKTENENLLDFFIGLNLQPREKLEFSQIIFYNWNEFAAKTEIVIVLE